MNFGKIFKARKKRTYNRNLSGLASCSEFISGQNRIVRLIFYLDLEYGEQWALKYELGKTS